MKMAEVTILEDITIDEILKRLKKIFLELIQLQ